MGVHRGKGDNYVLPIMGKHGILTCMEVLKMKKMLLGILVCSVLLSMCVTTYAIEPPVIDYEGFAERLKERGIKIPQTLDEAVGDTHFGDLPKYELTVDEETNRAIVRTDLITEDVSMMSNDFSLYADFAVTDEPGVYVAENVTSLDGFKRLRMVSRNALDPNVFDLWCTFDLATGRCEECRTEYYLMDEIFISKSLTTWETGEGSVAICIRDDVYGMRLKLEFDVTTGELCYVSVWDWEEPLAMVSYQYKEFHQLHVGDYDYMDGQWTLNDEPCEAPFELTPDMYPYPSFLP